MKKINLTQNKIAIIDDNDFSRISRYKWYAYNSRGVWYAGRTIYKNNIGRILQMHKFIFYDDINHNLNTEIDHINRNGLDNRKINLRFVNHSVNCRNRRKLKNTSSRYIGVSFDKKQNKWRSYIKINGKLIHLGLFKNELFAYKNRKKIEELIFKK